MLISLVKTVVFVIEWYLRLRLMIIYGREWSAEFLFAEAVADDVCSKVLVFVVDSDSAYV